MSTGPDVPTVDWVARHDRLAARRDELTSRELDELGLAAWFIGRPAESERAWDDAHRAYLADGDTDAAIRCVFWLGFTLSDRGEAVRAGAWMARLFELLGSVPHTPDADAAATVARSAAAFAAGRDAEAASLAEQAVALARDAGDADLEVLATMSMGRALVHAGRLVEGFACMDRVMLAVASGRVGDRAAGPAYCAVIASCLDRWDVDRARVWTRDLGAWCDAQQGLEPFRGECSVHRATVQRLLGEWDEAGATLTAVCDRELRAQTLENAYYGLAELCRLTGRRDEAEAAYRRAADLGREVQPGLALLRRDQGRLAAARAGIARALAAGGLPSTRAELLSACAELEAERGGDLGLARRAVAELRTLADTVGTDYLRAQADRAEARLLIGTDGAPRALPLLRRSWSVWRHLEAPYEAATTRVLMGRAARAAGDEEAAQLEFDAARTVLTGLGAVPDLDRLERVAAGDGRPAASAGLTRREVEVLRLIAAGRSNRQIADELFLSERTVARHVSNILGKLGLANRAAATAFAFEHGLTATA
ncbi:LuxR C-terminal-related transcriptional regulator [Agromyces aurantiacus]|uniref:LuxR C-terminal-related transcriptional regulator n=1 Tax=Agromyces aurantiacus TaxID=165814 RepID=A0ABV9R2Q4_9MICO|nr:LuxR C-terminal-related transcriptional regulator [Agromyces aurantiacus]MBM7505954.1 DNA-binding CsgD family transcriptional regulator/tetratricopeptide (TPR) repeat protein [Agromyces aurantiacus]